MVYVFFFFFLYELVRVSSCGVVLHWFCFTLHLFAINISHFTDVFSV